MQAAAPSVAAPTSKRQRARLEHFYGFCLFLMKKLGLS